MSMLIFQFSNKYTDQIALSAIMGGESSVNNEYAKKMYESYIGKKNPHISKC